MNSKKAHQGGQEAVKTAPDGLRCGGAVERSPPEPEEETTGKRIIEPGGKYGRQIFPLLKNYL